MPNSSGLTRRLLRSVELSARWAIRPLRDRVENFRQVTSRDRIMIVRHRLHLTSYYRTFLDWLAAELPEARRLFELHALPCHRRISPRTTLVVPWVSENMLSRTPTARRHFQQLEAAATAHGIPTINRLDAILRALKLEASVAIAAAGVRTPRMRRIEDRRRFPDDLAGQQLPLLVRENRAHGGATKSYLICNRAEAAQVPLEQFEDPIAVEYIDVQNPDGYFRKYRYLASGDRGVALSLQIARDWEVRGCHRAICDATRQEEMAHQRQSDRNHDRFQKVRRALGLDVVAFDYSYTRAGEVVVWEINVLPGMGLKDRPEQSYINFGARRGMAAVVEWYLQRAGLPIPAALSEMLATGQPPAASARAVA